MGGRGIELTRRPLCTNSKLLKVARLSDKLVGGTVPDKTEDYWFTDSFLKAADLQFVNIYLCS